MKAIALATLLGFAAAQYHPTCVYQSGPNGQYALNLTSISGYHLEYQTPADPHNYYYTPCVNNEVCFQGNAEFRTNAAQYTPGSNTCNHYLAVDHHETPVYVFGAAAWFFQFTDGEMCDQTQAPRDLNVWYLCDENFNQGAIFYDVVEDYTCHYTYTLRSPLACVPENSHNAMCQWRYFDFNANTSYYLDLSGQNTTMLHGVETNNGYEVYYSPCRNAIPCYQQSNQISMMSIVENRLTHTCDHYLAEWQDGRVQPDFHNENPDEIHWSFHYWLSEKCSNGAQGEETIRWYCDMDATNATVINSTYDGDCRWEFNVASSSACPSNYKYKLPY
jgi:hypothetical protein